VVRATHRVSFDVHAADRFVLLGPSGCGKSTLLKAVAGFVPPAEGEIRLEGSACTAGAGPHRRVPGIRPVAAVEDGAQNVMFPLRQARGCRRPRPTTWRCISWTRWGWRRLPMPIRTRCPAA
jgi:NitT/TauT family transport system ATP-binding protein